MHAPTTQSSADSAPATSPAICTPQIVNENRLAANRANAQKSTGPRTQEGKSQASKNALRHGAYAQSTLLPDDNPVHFQQLRTDFLHTLSPQTPFELYLAERAVSIAWRLQRFTQAAADLHFYRQNPLTDLFDDSHVDLTKAEDRLQSMLHRTLKQLQTLQKQRQETPPPPCPYLNETNCGAGVPPAIPQNEPTKPENVGCDSSHPSPENAQNEPNESDNLKPDCNAHVPALPQNQAIAPLHAEIPQNEPTDSTKKGDSLSDHPKST